MSMVVVAGGIYFAFSFPDIISGLELFWKPGNDGHCVLGGTILAAIQHGRRMGRDACKFCHLVATSTITIAGFTLWDFNAAYARHLPAWMLAEPATPMLALPWQTILYMSVGVLACIIVSLLTYRSNADRLENFHRVIRTPTIPGEPQTQPFTLPESVTAMKPVRSGGNL